MGSQCYLPPAEVTFPRVIINQQTALAAGSKMRKKNSTRRRVGIGDYVQSTQNFRDTPRQIKLLDNCTSKVDENIRQIEPNFFSLILTIEAVEQTRSGTHAEDHSRP